MTQAIIRTRADIIVAELSRLTGDSEEHIAAIVKAERKRLSCLRVQPTSDEIAERIMEWLANGFTHREEIGRIGVVTWTRKHSAAKVWATLNGMKIDGIRSVAL